MHAQNNPFAINTLRSPFRESRFSSLICYYYTTIRMNMLVMSLPQGNRTFVNMR